MCQRRSVVRECQGRGVRTTANHLSWTRVASIVGIAAVLLAIPCSAPPSPWRVFVFREGSFVRVAEPFRPVSFPAPAHGDARALVPPDWQVVSSALTDVTGDGYDEWVLLVWRPWQDWPIQRWSPVPSPITGNQDATGQSCQLILIDALDGRQIWAGSALPTPLTSMAVGDVDGDERREVVALEGCYTESRDGPSAHVDVWGWNGFGFTLEWRSPSSVFHQVCLTDANGDGTLDIAVR